MFGVWSTDVYVYLQSFSDSIKRSAILYLMFSVTYAKYSARKVERQYLFSITQTP